MGNNYFDGSKRGVCTSTGDGLQVFVNAIETPEVMSETELFAKWAKAYPVAADGSPATGIVYYGFDPDKCYGILYPGGTQFEKIDLSKIYLKVSVAGEGAAVVYATN